MVSLMATSPKEIIKKLSIALAEGNLSFEEELVARKIVIQLKAKIFTSPTARRIQHAKQREYFLFHTQTCRLCNSSFSRWFWMEDSKEGYLRAIPCNTPTGIKFKERKDYTYTCGECRERLQSWKRQDLIEKLISAYDTLRGRKRTEK